MSKWTLGAVTVAAVLGGAYLASRSHDEGTTGRTIDTLPIEAPDRYSSAAGPTTIPTSSRPYGTQTRETRPTYDARVPTLETVMRDYVPTGSTESRSTFYNTAIEQLIGSGGARGVVSLFEDLPRDGLTKDDSWRIWAAKDGTYKYKFGDGRHIFEINGAGDKSDFKLHYEILVDQEKGECMTHGERWGANDGAKAWEYVLPLTNAQQRGVIPMGAFIYDGTQTNGEPLWKIVSHEGTRPMTSGDAVWNLLQRNLDARLKDLR